MTTITNAFRTGLPTQGSYVGIYGYRSGRLWLGILKIDVVKMPGPQPAKKRYEIKRKISDRGQTEWHAKRGTPCKKAG